MTTLREAAEAALEALEGKRYTACGWRSDCDKAITALKAALAEPPKPAPLKRGTTGRCTRKVCECEKEGLGLECIYLEPVIDGYPLWSGMPKAERKPLTEERNFCPRCGKRTNDIHTCTPPLTEEGCDHCNHPLYAAIKCRQCGRVTE